MQRRLVVTIGLAVFVCAGSPAHGGIDLPAACREQKAKATGRKAADLLKAHGKNRKRPNPSKLASDISKAHSKFTRAFSKAEVKGGCATVSDAGTVAAKVDAFVTDAIGTLCPSCGDGIPAPGEECDDGNPSNNDPCVDGCVPATCGDGFVCGEPTCATAAPPTISEECDDGNLVESDGCSGLCVVESGWSCGGEPTVCTEICGDGIVAGGEECDDGNTQDDDCCSPECVSIDGPCCVSGESACCAVGLDLLSFETGIPTGTCGVLRAFRCSNNSSAACAEDSDCNAGSCIIVANFCWDGSSVGPPCTQDADCQGTCNEVSAGNLPLDLACGSGYLGGGLNSVPMPIPLPDRSRSYVQVTECDSLSGVLTLGPTTSSEVGERHCTSGRECSLSATPCVMDVDCPPTETCDTQCFFGAPMPATNVSTPPTSYCVINHVAEDASGTVSCGGSVSDLSLPLRAVFHRTGDLLSSSDPPDIPGVQPCPICDTVCQGGPKHRFPCADGIDCPEGSCGSLPQCLGGFSDGNLCTPETSGTAELGDGFPTSHDCPPDPLTDVTGFSGGIPLKLSLTTGSITVNAVDQPNGDRVFFGFCRDILEEGSYCFEGDLNVGRCYLRSDGRCHNDLSPCWDDADCPGSFCFYWLLSSPFACLDESDCPEDGFVYQCLPNRECPPSTPPAPESPVNCTSDADCDDGDEYESCVQRDPGAFSDSASTRIEVSGETDGQCLADGQPHASTLTSVFAIPPTFDSAADAAFDLPGPGAVLLQGKLRLE